MYAGGFDLVAKASEGIKNSASLQTQRLDRQRHPLAIYPDRLVRQYAPNESAAYALLSLCEPDALHSQGRRAEAYVYHHTIDYRPPIPGAPIRTRALVVTTRRVVFGSVDPPRVKFEVPLAPALNPTPHPNPDPKSNPSRNPNPNPPRVKFEVP